MNRVPDELGAVRSWFAVIHAILYPGIVLTLWFFPMRWLCRWFLYGYELRAWQYVCGWLAVMLFMICYEMRRRRQLMSSSNRP